MHVQKYLYTIPSLPPPAHKTGCWVKELELENRTLRDQQVHPALSLLAARPELFVRQGTVAASCRRRGTQSYGPYYRLTYHDGGRQHSIYLGREGPLVEQVRLALARLQQNRSQCQFLERTRRQTLASLRVHKLRVNALLHPYGLRMKGFEVRGWRTSPLKQVLASLHFGPFKASKVAKGRKSCGTPLSTPQARLQAFLDARERKLTDGDGGGSRQDAPPC
jgi:hypothetical protein